MDFLFLGIVVFLFLLAVFDLSVGVSNDAVNFLTSAVGSRAASFKRIIFVAAIGIFIGAAMSNGMMDVARHGIFRPENFSFFDIICIFMAVMVTDVILLNVFNTLGMPTSTTVSLVFELLGATFVVALFKISSPDNFLDMNDLINTEKALSVILGIFLSVAIAFVFGVVVQFVARLIFTFEYKSRLKWKVGLFGGLACTAIIYFMLLKGFKDLSVMTPALKVWVDAHTWQILIVCFTVFTLLMQLLHLLKVNVLKIVVLSGTFALAMAFAGNDLVNFIGVPLTSLSSYNDYIAGGGGDVHGFMMSSLNSSADTPVYFLIGAGCIMVVALATSKKARRVTQTTVGLSAQGAQEEMFGSSRLGRSLVRLVLNINAWFVRHMPLRLRNWLRQRMDLSKAQPEQGAAFDLVRGAVNLVLAGVLIAIGTSMKLPLSTTFVTFMVAMGTSLADRAWGRESAVFRVTGVISVIGGWFITAAVAFMGAGIIVCLMYFGGVVAMIAGGVLALAILVRSHLAATKKQKQAEGDALFQAILSTEDKHKVWPLLQLYVNDTRKAFLEFTHRTYAELTSGFMNDNAKQLAKIRKALNNEKDMLKSQRRKLTLCMRCAETQAVLEKGTWFHLGNNMAISMVYSLRRMDEVCGEHVENNFRPLPKQFQSDFSTVRNEILSVLEKSVELVGTCRFDEIDILRSRCEKIKDKLSRCAATVYSYLHEGDTDDMTVSYVYLNLLQESREFVTAFRKLLRASGKFNLSLSSYRSFTKPHE